MKNLLFFALALLIVGCGGAAAEQEQASAATPEPKAPATDNTLTEAEKTEGWMLLFDGQSTEG
ncbi:MAG: hypothetical protein MRY85_01600, partial [Phaeodactylibacter sp.]|nr:hypothetical protein [Phaeodactylibacter sp.]